MFGHPAQDLGSRLVGDELAASGAEAALLQEHLEFDEQSDQSFFVFFFHFQFSSFIFMHSLVPFLCVVEICVAETQRPPEKRYFCVYVIATRASLWSTIAPQTLARWESHAAPNSMHRKGPRHRGFRIRKSVVYAKKCNARPWWNLISCMRALVVVMDVMLCRDMSN